MRKTAIIVLICLITCAMVQAGMPFRRSGSRERMFPGAGDIPDLHPSGKVLTYRNENLKDYYGANIGVYLQYGINTMVSCEYTYGSRDRRLTIEMASMEDASSAAGLFHHHRGKVIEESAPAPVGAEGAVDIGREGRNLYFYRSNIFVKIIYSGRDPVPDLTVIGRFIDQRIPGGRDAKPEGLDYIDVDGVDIGTVAITPGFCFNLSIFPPAVWASAPGGGSPASDMFIITRLRDRDATELFNDYLSYLKLSAEYVEEYRRGSQRFAKAVDPNQGRVVFTHYRNAVILAVRPDGYDKGEVLIDAVMAKIDEVNPAKGGRR